MDALLGFPSHIWRVKHNVAHHTYTNVEGWDDDINQQPVLRLTRQAARPLLPPRGGRLRELRERRVVARLSRNLARVRAAVGFPAS